MILCFYKMTKYNTINVNLSNSQFNKLRSQIQNGTEIILSYSSNFIGNSHDETKFPHKLLLADTQVQRLCKAFADGSSANINFSKTQLSRMILSRGILADLRAAQIMFYTTNNVFDWSRSIKKKSKKGVTLGKNVAPELAENLTGYYVKKGIN